MDQDLVKKELLPLDKSKAASIRKVFDPMVAMLESMEGEYDEVMKMEMSPETCGLARGLRLRISKIRIEADKLRIEQKAQYNLAGNAIQAVFNLLKFAVTDKEAALKEKEEYYENLEKKRIADLQKERLEILEEFAVDGSVMRLGDMTPEVWDNYFAGVKLKFESDRAEEKAATEAQLLREKQFKIMEIRKVELMPYGQFNPLLDLFPETPEEEYQEILANMKKLKKDFDDKQEAIRLENEKLKEEVKIVKEEIKEVKEAKPNIIPGLFGKKEPEPKEVKDLSYPVNSSDKDILNYLSITIRDNSYNVKSKAAKDALILASNTLKMAAMMM